MSIIASRRRFGLVIKGLRVEVVTGLQQCRGWAGQVQLMEWSLARAHLLYNHHTAEHDLSPGIEMAIFMKINCSSVIAH